MTLAPHVSKVDDLVRCLDEAVLAPNDAARCRNVKPVLMDVVNRGEAFVPGEMLHLENGGDRPAVTIHVYGGEMTHCHIVEPVEGSTDRRRDTELACTP